MDKVYLSVLLVVDTWLVCSVGPLSLKLLYSCGFVTLSFRLGKYLGVKLLCYLKKVCLSLYATEKSFVK